MENSVKALIMGATVLIVLVIIGIGVMILNTSKGMAKTANDEITDIAQELTQMKFDSFDGTKVSGSTALNALRKYKDEANFGIKVVTGKNTTGIWYGHSVDADGVVSEAAASGAIADAQDESDVNYVNPSGKFDSQLIIDKSNVVRAIIFTQQ